MLEKIIEALKTADDVETLDNAKEINIKVIDGNSVEIEAEFCDEEEAMKEADCECENHCQDCECKDNEISLMDIIGEAAKVFSVEKSKVNIAHNISEIVTTLEYMTNVDDEYLEELNDAIEGTSDTLGMKYTVKIVRR